MEESERVFLIRHSLSHLLAAAMRELYPGVKLGIGPVIENGFYYDFRIPAGAALGAETLPTIEAKMRELAAHTLPFSKRVLPAQELRKLFADEPFKLELIGEYEREGKELSVYDAGDAFTDLCKGGHVDNTSEIPLDGFKLTHIAGAYWRGDEHNEMLTRIYGAAFGTKRELDEYLRRAEEARRRDHRKLGKELDLFAFSELVGPGLPLYTPKGAIVLSEIKNYSRMLRREMGYQEVQTPQINRAELFKTSGHYDKYRDSMFRVQSNYTDDEYFLKPMNCPQHVQIYASQSRSYRDLPLRYADFSLLYRDEKPGELSGLTRLRSFSQDDAHCFCRPDQLEEEFSRLLDAIKRAMGYYGMDYYIRFSLRDEAKKEQYLGDDVVWESAQRQMQALLDAAGIEYVRAEGEAAFYGPKMDLMARDVIGREWQLSTIQLDMNMPGRFGITYVGEDGGEHTPLMIHSALVGSPERFFGVLIEHYGGAFPAWLAPVQVVILPIGEKHSGYAKEVMGALVKRGARVEFPEPNETLGNRIRKAELEKVPYIVVVGDKEIASKTVNVRSRDDGSQREMTVEEFSGSGW